MVRSKRLLMRVAGKPSDYSVRGVFGVALHLIIQEIDHLIEKGKVEMK